MQGTLDALCGEIANLSSEIQEQAHRFSNTPKVGCELERVLEKKCAQALEVLDALRKVVLTFPYDTY